MLSMGLADGDGFFVIAVEHGFSQGKYGENLIAFFHETRYFAA